MNTLIGTPKLTRAPPSAPSSIRGLPTELLAHILAYLQPCPGRTLTDILTVGQVCRRWRHVSLRLPYWRHLSWSAFWAHRRPRDPPWGNASADRVSQNDSIPMIYVMDEDIPTCITAGAKEHDRRHAEAEERAEKDPSPASLFYRIFTAEPLRLAHVTHVRLAHLSLTTVSLVLSRLSQSAMARVHVQELLLRCSAHTITFDAVTRYCDLPNLRTLRIHATSFSDLALRGLARRLMSASTGSHPLQSLTLRGGCRQEPLLQLLTAVSHLRSLTLDSMRSSVRSNAPMHEEDDEDWGDAVAFDLDAIAKRVPLLEKLKLYQDCGFCGWLGSFTCLRSVFVSGPFASFRLPPSKKVVDSHHLCQAHACRSPPL